MKYIALLAIRYTNSGLACGLRYATFEAAHDVAIQSIKNIEVHDGSVEDYERLYASGQYLATNTRGCYSAHTIVQSIVKGMVDFRDHIANTRMLHRIGANGKTLLLGDACLSPTSFGDKFVYMDIDGNVRLSRKGTRSAERSNYLNATESFKLSFDSTLTCLSVADTTAYSSLGASLALNGYTPIMEESGCKVGSMFKFPPDVSALWVPSFVDGVSGCTYATTLRISDGVEYISASCIGTECFISSKECTHFCVHLSKECEDMKELVLPERISWNILLWYPVFMLTVYCALPETFTVIDQRNYGMLMINSVEIIGANFISEAYIMCVNSGSQLFRMNAMALKTLTFIHNQFGNSVKQLDVVLSNVKDGLDIYLCDGIEHFSLNLLVCINTEIRVHGNFVKYFSLKCDDMCVGTTVKVDKSVVTEETYFDDLTREVSGFRIIQGI